MHIDRRQFCKIMAGGILTGGLSSALFDVQAASPYGRPKNAYLLGHLPPELQPVSMNPNLPAQISQQQTFQNFINHWQVPGIAYVTGDNPVRAAAAGIVHFVGTGKDRNNRPSGTYVRVAHDIYDGLQKQFYPRVTLYRYQAYRSTYYYLSRVNIQQWQAVKRGQIIGYGSRFEKNRPAMFKLVLEERGNPVNPDDYGRKHGFMQLRKKGRTKEITREQMNRRVDDQIAVVREMNAAFKWKEKSQLLKKIHCYVQTEKFYDYPVKWSTIEQFRFLTNLYSKDPLQFTGLSQKKIVRLSKKFRDLQPVVLTLPFD